MSDDRVRLHMEASVVSVSSSLFYSVQKMCTSASYRITMTTLSLLSILNCHCKYFSEKYIKSQLKVY